MLNKKLLVLILSLFITCKIGVSQVKNGFIIISFELVKSKQDNKQVFYWITSVDSIDNKINFSIYPLYFEEFSSDNLEKCKKGDTVDIFINTSETNFKFDNNYLLQLEQLSSLINDNRTKLQSISLNWFDKNRNKEIVNIYATPILGDFCNCLQISEKGGSKNLDFKTMAYMPVSSFVLNKGFWNTENGKVIKFADYSLVDFTGHLPSNMHRRSLCRAKDKVYSYK